MRKQSTIFTFFVLSDPFIKVETYESPVLIYDCDEQLEWNTFWHFYTAQVWQYSDHPTIVHMKGARNVLKNSLASSS